MSAPHANAAEEIVGSLHATQHLLPKEASLVRPEYQQPVGDSLMSLKRMNPRAVAKMTRSRKPLDLTVQSFSLETKVEEHRLFNQRQTRVCEM